jgi:hypothetical protein
MPAASESDLRLEIGHVLLIDIVGYSKLLITEQREGNLGPCGLGRTVTGDDVDPAPQKLG